MGRTPTSLSPVRSKWMKRSSGVASAARTATSEGVLPGRSDRHDGRVGLRGHRTGATRAEVFAGETGDSVGFVLSGVTPDEERELLAWAGTAHLFVDIRGIAQSWRASRNRINELLPWNRKLASGLSDAA